MKKRLKNGKKLPQSLFDIFQTEKFVDKKVVGKSNNLKDAAVLYYSSYSEESYAAIAVS